MSDIFREVEEDVRRERLEKIWKEYGDYIVAALALLILAGAARLIDLPHSTVAAPPRTPKRASVSALILGHSPGSLARSPRVGESPLAGPCCG